MFFEREWREGEDERSSCLADAVAERRPARTIRAQKLQGNRCDLVEKDASRLATGAAARAYTPSAGT